MQDLKRLIRSIADYPKPGIVFRDVTTLLGDAQGFKAAIARMAEPYRTEPVDAVAGIEARGFILGGAVADRLGCGFLPIRKGERVLIVDDLIATGGTAEAAVKLVRRSGGDIIGAVFVIDLPELGGRKRLEALGVKCHTLMEFEGH